MDSNDGEIKKILLTLTSAVIIVIGIYCLFYFTILPQSPETQRELIIFDLYRFITEDHSSSPHLKDQKVIFFIGSSQMRNGLDTHIVEADLREKNISSDVYNLGIDGDTPSRRIRELNYVIAAHPEVVIISISYFGCHNNTIEEYTRYVGNDTKNNLFGIPTFFSQGRKMLNYFIYGPINETKTKNEFKSAFNYSSPSLSELKQRHDDVIKNLIPEKGTDAEQQIIRFTIVTQENNGNKEDLLYFIQKLKENNIKVILINMPINPMMSEIIPDSTRENYSAAISNIVNTTGAVYYDYEKNLHEEDFIDVFHFTTKGGSEKFSHEISQIILTDMAK